MKKTLVSLITVSALAACGGSGDAGDAGFDALVASASDTFERFEVITDLEGQTPFEAVALDGGTATYSGAVIVDESDFFTEETVFGAVGTLTATADFSSPSVTATATNFFEIDIEETLVLDEVEFTDLTTLGSIEGSFEFNLAIADDGFGFAGASGTVDGGLTKTDGSTLVLTDEGALGGFAGDNLDAFAVIGGGVTGDTVTTIAGFGLRD